MAITTGTSVSLISAPEVPGQGDHVVPVLQAQDGSFVGTAWTGEFGEVPYMLAFDATGSVRWMLPGYGPKIATADGGVIAQAYDPATYDFTGAALTFDQSGSVTGQMDLPTYSWVWNAYQVGSVDQVVAMLPFFATTFWALQGGNMSYTPTAAQPLPDRVQAMYDVVTPDPLGAGAVLRNITYSLYQGSGPFRPSANAVIEENLVYSYGQKPKNHDKSKPGGQFLDGVGTRGNGPFGLTQQFLVDLPGLRQYRVRIVPCVAWKTLGEAVWQNINKVTDQTVMINDDAGSTEGRNCNN
jgi:hypothetical protein